MSIEHLYDKLGQYKDARDEARRKGNQKIVDYVNLKMLSIIKQIREEREREQCTSN